MCTGIVPVSSLASVQTVSITCQLNVIKVVGVSATPTVGVTLAIQQEKVNLYFHNRHMCTYSVVYMYLHVPSFCFFPLQSSTTLLTSKGGVASLPSNKQHDHSSSARRNLAQVLFIIHLLVSTF